MYKKVLILKKDNYFSLNERNSFMLFESTSAQVFVTLKLTNEFKFQTKTVLISFDHVSQTIADIQNCNRVIFSSTAYNRQQNLFFVNSIHLEQRSLKIQF